jgi:hypothetical protein
MYVPRWFLLSVLLCSLVGCSSPRSAPTPDVGSASPPSPPAPDVTQGVPGGGCVYVEFAGTCEITGAGVMTFKGMVDGAEVTLAGNSFDPDRGSFADPTVGKSAGCSLKFQTEGGCTPCEISHGSCGQAAWDAHAAFSARHARAPAAAR